MAERIVMSKEEFKAKDDVTGAETIFSEQTPRGDSGKAYRKNYVSIPSKGGWFAADEDTGEILSTNPVIGYSSDSLTEEQKKKTLVSPTNCPACDKWYINPLALADHCLGAHKKTYEVLKEAKLEAEEQAVQQELTKRPVGRPRKDAPEPVAA